MQLHSLTENTAISKDPKSLKIFQQSEKILLALGKFQLPDNITASINAATDEINATQLSGKPLQKLLKQKQTQILTLLEKDLKIVPENHYRNQWMVLGMTAFGLPMGVAFGASIGNMGLLALGLPIGMAIGLAIGSGMDKKALEEGRQMQLEVKD